MPMPKICQVCRKEFSHRSLEFDHHYACYFDKNTNAWLDHGSEPEERTERKVGERRGETDLTCKYYLRQNSLIL